MEFDINYLAVFVAGLSSMAVGFLWYGPLFGKAWSMEMGWGNLSKEEIQAKQKKAVPGYVLTFVFALVTAYVFAHILIAFDSMSIEAALQGVFFTWLGFILPVHVGKKMWENKTWKLVAIDAGYSLVGLAVVGIILQIWK